jgi:hypothetical protein
MSLDLTQAEADALIAMPKRPAKGDTVQFPSIGGKLVIPLQSVDKTEDFILDVNRSRINIAKITHQNRAHIVVVLLRLDINGSPHRNPDDETVPCPHLHIYREGYGDKWAFPLKTEQFGDTSDMVQTLTDFLNVCNVVELPPIQVGLF